MLEKGQFPREEAAFKVGESTSEVAAFYLREMLGLKQHLEQEQLVKFGLRFFFSYRDNQDISQRVEAGRSQPSPIATYQLDRGRLENFLQQRALSMGCTVLEECKVTDVELKQEAHHVEFTQKDGPRSVLTRWIVDASGRAGVLKRKLELKAPVEHNVSAAWFRLSSMVDLEEWSQDSQWSARTPGGKRWLSTNHLVGKGYWGWLIPLASGSISIGIVADTQVHPFETFNRFDRAMQWLQKYEPQCYLKVTEREGDLQDFKVQRNFALNSSQVFSAQRWAITGEAGRFLDPLYSIGSDFIAIANTFITNLIYYDFSGEEGESVVAAYDQIHASFFQFFLQIYQNQYPLFEKVQVMVAKLVWDNALYWGFFTLLFFNRKLADLAFMSTISDEIARLRLLQSRMFNLLR